MCALDANGASVSATFRDLLVSLDGLTHVGGRTAPLSASLSSGAESLYHNVFLPSAAGIRLVCRSRAMNNAAVDFLCVSRCVHINFCSLVISFFVQWYVIRGGFAGSWVMNMVFCVFFFAK